MQLPEPFVSVVQPDKNKVSERREGCVRNSNCEALPFSHQLRQLSLPHPEGHLQKHTETPRIKLRKFQEPTELLSNVKSPSCSAGHQRKTIKTHRTAVVGGALRARPAPPRCGNAPPAQPPRATQPDLQPWGTRSPVQRCQRPHCLLLRALTRNGQPGSEEE